MYTGEDLGVTEMEDPLLLVLAYKLGAKTLWEFTYDEFVTSLGRNGYVIYRCVLAACVACGGRLFVSKCVHVRV